MKLQQSINGDNPMSHPDKDRWLGSAVGGGSAPYNLRFLFLDVVLLISLGAYTFWGMARAPFHGDEIAFVAMSRDFVELFERNNSGQVLYNPDPQTEPPNQFIRLTTGAVSPFTIWLTWHLAGFHAEDVPQFWDWIAGASIISDWEAGVARGLLPTEQLLLAVRVPSTLFTVMSIALVFILALVLLQSRLAAWAATLLYATTPSILLNGQRAMQEGATLFFTSLVVCCVIPLLREQTRAQLKEKRLTFWYAALGAASGFAVATKHTALLVIVPIYLALLLQILLLHSHLKGSTPQTTILQIVFLQVGSGLMTQAIYYALTPIWWYFALNSFFFLLLSCFFFLLATPDISKKVKLVSAALVALVFVLMIVSPQTRLGLYRPLSATFWMRAGLIETQISDEAYMQSYDVRISKLLEELLIANAQYFETSSWKNIAAIQKQIQSYEVAHLDGRGGGWYWGIPLAILAIAGLWKMVVTWQADFIRLLALWLLIPAALIIVTNPLPWQRYYLLLIAPFSIVCGLGFQVLFQLGVAALARGGFRLRSASGL